MSLLDFLNRKDDEPLKGVYYEHKPLTPDDTGTPFSYDIANAREVNYINVLQNINTAGQTQTIKTNDLKGFKLKSYIALQDGGLWQIQGFTKKPASDSSKQVLRIRRESNDVSYIIRLIYIYDERGIAR